MENEMRKQLLVVCTGNTCRSPMAAAILNHILQEQGLDGQYFAHSVGVAAFDHQPAAENAVAAAKENGLDLSGHQSKRIPLEDVAAAEHIFVMSEDQRRLLASAVPDAAEKITVMQVPDPFGGDMEVYRACFAQIKDWFSRYFEEHPLCRS